MKRTFQTLLAASIASFFCLGTSAEAQILVSNNFATGVTFSNWYWTGGTFQNPPTFGQAWNQASTGNQFFTTSFTPTSLSVGDKMTASFQYNPNSTNINSVRVGLFSGTAASTSGWDQYNNGTAPSSTWTGYIGTLAISNGNSIASLKGSSGTHPFFGAPTASNAVAQSFSTGTIRAARLTLERTTDSILVTLSEGAGFGSLNTIVSYTNASAAVTNFNVFSLYSTTATGNADMRYDNVTVEYQAIPEPSTYALLGLSGLGLAAYRLRLRRRSSSAQTKN